VHLVDTHDIVYKKTTQKAKYSKPKNYYHYAYCKINIYHSQVKLIEEFNILLS